MPELKSQEEKFERFWGLIQEQAEKESSKFFMDCGEGREIETDEISGEDISGWLIPMDQVSEFEKEWKKEESKLDAWDECLRIAEWSEAGGQISINFSRY